MLESLHKIQDSLDELVGDLEDDDGFLPDCHPLAQDKVSYLIESLETECFAPMYLVLKRLYDLKQAG
jgi:hypothetical protein